MRKINVIGLVIGFGIGAVLLNDIALAFILSMVFGVFFKRPKIILEEKVHEKVPDRI